MSHAVTLNWIGGEHTFALDIGGLRAVQEVCAAGPMQIHSALVYGTWRVDYPLAVLRHGLIGGGMTRDEAQRLLQTLTEAHPLASFVGPAAAVLAAAVVGVPDDPVGEPKGAMSPPEN